MNENEKNVQYGGDLPENIKRFMRTIKDGGLHNIYYLKTVDMDGNVTSEAYGKNLMTDYGLSNWTLSSNNYASNVNISTSDVAPTLSDTSMPDLFKPPGVSSGTLIKYNIVYFKKSHIAAKTIFTSQVYWDYNYSDITNPIVFNTIGIYAYSPWGSSPSYQNTLMFHSYIYDEDGNKTSITKNINERLYISIYITAMMDVDIIDDIEKRNDIHLLIDPDMFNTYSNRTFDGGIQPLPATKTSVSADYYNYRKIVSDIFSGTASLNNHTYTTTKSATDVARMYESMLHSVIGTVFWAGTTLVGYKFDMKLDTPEELSTIYASTDDFESNDFDAMFADFNVVQSNDAFSPSVSAGGMYNRSILPVSDFTISSLQKYDFSQHEWTDVPYTSGTLVNHHFNVGSFHLGFGGNPVYFGYPGVTYIFDHNNYPGAGFVYMNPHPEYEMDYFTANGIDGTFAMTDNYFDIDSFVIVIAGQQLPKHVRNMKYIVKLGGGNSSGYFNYHYLETPTKSTSSTAYSKNKLNLDHESIDLSQLYKGISTTTACIDATSESDGNSNNEGWIALNKAVIFNPESDANRVVKELYTSDMNCYGNGVSYKLGEDKLIKYCGPNSSYFDRVRIFDLSDSSVATIPYTDVSFNASIYYQCSANFSKLGYASIYYNGTARILDLVSNSPGLLLTQQTDLCMLGENSKYFIYHDTTVVSRTEFVVYDCTTGSIAERFYFPTNVTYTLQGIFVWKQHIYIQYVDSNNVSNIYYHEALSGETTLTSLDKTSTCTTYWPYYRPYRSSSADDEIRISSIDDICIIAMPTDNTKFVVLTDETVGTLGKSPSFGSTVNSSIRAYFKLPHIKYSTDGKSLLVAATTFLSGTNNDYYSNTVIDLGKLIDIDNYVIDRYSGYGYDTKMYYRSLIMYKDYIVIVYNPYSSSDRSFRMIPYERFLQYKMIGTTRTISGYNNPFRITYNPQSILTLSNEMNRILHRVPTDDTYIHVVNRMTNEETTYSTQAAAVSYLAQEMLDNPDVMYNVYMGDNASETFAGGFNNLTNLVEFRTNSKINAITTFAGATNLRRFVVADGVEHFNIAAGAFSGTPNLIEFYIPEDTVLQYVGDGGFSGTGLSEISATFDSTVSGTAGPFPNQGIFASSKKLMKVNISCDVDARCSFGAYSFSGCNNLTEFNVDGAVDEISYGAFSNTGIPNIHFDSVNKIYADAFRINGVSGPFTTVSLEIGGSSFGGIGSNAFTNNKNLKHITLPEVVTNSIDDTAFNDIPEYYIKIGNNETDSGIGTAPWGNPNSAGVFYIPQSTLVIFGTGDVNTGLYESDRDIVTIKFNTTPSSIASTAFTGCINVTDIYVPWSSGDIPGAPWGATNATVHYDQT